MKNFNMADDYHTSQSNMMTDNTATNGQQHPQQQQTAASNARQQQVGAMDEMSQDLTYLSRDAPLDGGESTFGAATSYSQLAGSQREESVLHMGSDLHDAENKEADERGRQLESPTRIYNYNEQVLNQLSPDNVDIQRPLQQAGSIEAQQQASESTLLLKPFLVSFMVDARGGAMRGCRHSGVRVIIPPNSAQMPMRITCRYLRRERLVHPPPLMEGEACASKIMEVGPSGAKFLGPVLIEVPHFASLRGQEREIIILRSDSGEIWREHLVEPDDKIIDSIIRSAQSSTSQQQLADDDQHQHQQQQEQMFDQENLRPVSRSSNIGDENRRLTRIVTNEFPQYFAIISRIRQEVHAIGPDGTTVNSQVVPRVQAIFTEGALTKRIKIGLQPKGNKKDNQAQHQEDSHLEHTKKFLSQRPDSGVNQQQNIPTQRSPSPGADQLDSLGSSQERAVSPQSNQGSQANQQQRPSSAAAKRRSRFLACFGAGQGSADLLDSATDECLAGDDSPRQPCSEKLVKRRYILDDVDGSDGEERDSPSLSSLSAEPAPTLKRNKRHVLERELELVPDDYYIEKEPPLILNIEPKTYGKRMASSSAQTDSKLNVNDVMSTSTRKSSKKRGLLRGKRKNRTQLTIHCDAQPVRPKSALGSDQLADSSLDTDVNRDQQYRQQQQQQQQQLPTDNKQVGLNEDETSSIIQDVFTSDDQKWRTCIIQTDSDSVIVNYVTSATDHETNSEAAMAAAVASGSGQDDGYVSGSGDINKQSSFSKNLFGLSAAFGGADKHQQAQLAAAADDDESKRARKKGAKKTKEPKGKDVAGQKTGVESPTVDEASDEQVTTGDSNEMRSISPGSNKEQKLRLKLERQEKLKREKEEKRQLKELEDAAAKEEKLKKKRDKEAKKAEKLAQKMAKKSPPASVPQTPLPDEQQAAQGSIYNKTISVKFANTLVETNSIQTGEEDSTSAPVSASEPWSRESAQQFDPIQRVVETTSANYEKDKKRLAQIGERDMAIVPIAELSQPQSVSSELDSELSGRQVPPAGEPKEFVVELSDSQTQPSDQAYESQEASSKSLDLDSLTPGQQATTKKPKSAARSTSESISSSSSSSGSSSNSEHLINSESIVVSSEPLRTNLKPILKQQSTISTSGEEGSVEIVITEERKLAAKLIGEATDEAVKAADQVEGRIFESPAGSLSKKELAKRAKEEKERQKREAKLRVAEEKRQASEYKRLAKEAQLAKRAEEVAQKLAIKQAKAEIERQAKEAKAEEARLAKEAKKKSKVKKGELTVAQQELPSAPQASELLRLEEEVGPSDNGKPKEIGENEPAASIKTLEPQIDDQSTQPEEVINKKRTKKQPKEGHKKEKLDTVLEVSKPGWFRRLFSRRSTTPAPAPAQPSTTGSNETEQLVAVGKSNISGGAQRHSDDKPVILSEMYPSDPDDADGEMILEVNVPKNLIDVNRQLASGGQHEQVLHQQADPSDSSMADAIDQFKFGNGDCSRASGNTTASPTLAATTTTIDQSLVTTDGQADEQHSRLIEQPPSGADLSHGGDHYEEDQATLVTGEMEIDDEDATENVVSQAIGDGLGLEQEIALEDESQRVLGTLEQVQEKEEEMKQIVKRSKSELLAEEKTRKELEEKLEVETKKRAKEEEKLERKRAKEEESRAKKEKKLAESEAKRRAKEEKARIKREVKEEKRLAALAKKQRKKGAAGVVSVDPSASVVVSDSQVFKQSSQAASAPGLSAAEGTEQQQMSGATDGSDMTPVNTETEVQRFVEEVVGDDGVVTKTTKTIETKYVTLRQEEVRMSEHSEMPIEEYERLQHERVKRSSFTSSSSSSSSSSAKQQVLSATSTFAKGHLTIVGPYEHAELDELRATPSYFDAPLPTAELEGESSPKNEMKKRIKLNQKLIKRANKLARSELKLAKKRAHAAESEIAVCDEAVKQACHENKRAQKESKRAQKLAVKQHKKMDKIDKKLAKQQRKIEKNERKFEKFKAKLAKKEAKKQEKLAKKETKETKALERKLSSSSSSKRSSSSSSGNKRSIKLEDIGEPVLRSSSRLSIGQAQVEGSSEMVNGNQQGSTVIERASPVSNDIQVEMSLDDAEHQHHHHHNQQPDSFQELAQVVTVHTTTTTITERPDGQLTKEVVSEQVSRANQADTREGDSEEEIDVVNDLPCFRNSATTTTTTTSIISAPKREVGELQVELAD